MKKSLSILVLTACLILATVSRAFAGVDVQYVGVMPPTRIPEITYWFWESNTLANAHYLDDVDNMATNSAYTLTLMTEREGVDFYDYQKMHEPFAETVREAHLHHLKVGLQLWEYWSGVHANNLTGKSPRQPLPLDQAQALVTEGEVTLDDNGHADYTAPAASGRSLQAFHSEVLRVYAFRQRADGSYLEGSLIDLTPQAKTVSSNPATVVLSIDAPPTLAGYTAYIMVAHYYDFPDLFNNVMINKYHEILEHYADIPFDGTALDEFGTMMVVMPKDGKFRERFYGQAFAKAFKKRTGTPLVQALFDMRFAPEGKPEVRIRAINDYFDVLRQGPLRVEQAFHKMSKKIFGPNTFAGIHNTFHNTMRSDDVWRVGFNWWTNPREYGQSDENWPMPQCMGLCVVHPEPITIDQLYSHNLNAFTQKAFRDAPFDGRIDYHGWNDHTGRWGIDLSDTKRCAPIRDAELKIRLLNQFNPPAPKLSVLIVFGMPALIDWYPDDSARSPWDINDPLANGKSGIEQKAAAIWHAGYPCALLPSDFIDNGQITFDQQHHPVVNGHRFDCLVYLYPQYAKESTLRFLDRYTKAGGKLMLEGTATRDFSGSDIAAQFDQIAARATVRGFDLSELPDLGAQTNTLTDGAFMEDGSVVLADFPSWQKNGAKPFSVNLNGHEFSGSYLGVCALKADPSGQVEKFACGGFTELKRDGKVIFSLEHPADIVITQKRHSNYDAVIVGSRDNHLETPAAQNSR